MNPDLARLRPYPFQRLRELLQDAAMPDILEPISLAVGEPKHPTPGFIGEALLSHLHGLSSYPLTQGQAALRETIAGWLATRFGLPAAGLDPERHVLPVNGTREALFALAQTVVDRSRPARVLIPNPFYQIYEGAALLAGAEPYYMNAIPEHGFRADLATVPETVWRDCQLLYVCSPGNPAGSVLSGQELQQLIALAERYDFVIAADECYSEIYFDGSSPPPGLLGAAAAIGNDDYRRCIVFHSLSKRSNAPGLRSGFVAGDASLIERFHLYRTYHGCAMPPPTQAASIAAWSDEGHVAENRSLYTRKFDAVLEVLGPVLEVERPDAGFYLWPRTPIDDQDFARRLYIEQAVTVLPGSYLSRDTDRGNPGHGRVRIALVAPLEECVEAAHRIRELAHHI
jgi:N-succinyldiaminopimelate aminotransferase